MVILIFAQNIDRLYMLEWLWFCQGHYIERTTHSMEIAHEILTMYYALLTCPISRSGRYCRHFEIR